MIFANANNARLRKFNFENVFRPVLQFLHIAGLWPFSIKHYSNGKIRRARVGFFDIAWSILILCFDLVIVFSTFKKLKSGRAKDENRIRFVVYNAFKMTFLLFGAFGILLDVINRNKLVDILQKFNTFDNEVRFIFTGSSILK